MATITTTKNTTIEIEMDVPVSAALLASVLASVPPEATFVQGTRAKGKLVFMFARPEEVIQTAV